METSFGQADFYLAASGLIPVLALADVVIRRRFVALSNAPLVSRLNRAAPWAELAGAGLWSALFISAEFACLRSLEVRRASFGAPVLVWVALTILAVQTVGYVVVDKLGDALPSVFLDEPPRSVIPRLWRD